MEQLAVSTGADGGGRDVSSAMATTSSPHPANPQVNRGGALSQNGYGAGYLKAVWPDLCCAFLRYGWPRGPGKAFKNVGGASPPTFLKASPGPRGRPDRKRTPKNMARLPSGTQNWDPSHVRPEIVDFRRLGAQSRPSDLS